MLTDPNTTEEKIFEYIEEFISNAKTGNHTKLGWGDSAYNTSKAILNSYTRFVLPKKVK